MTVEEGKRLDRVLQQNRDLKHENEALAHQNLVYSTKVMVPTQGSSQEIENYKKALELEKTKSRGLSIQLGKAQKKVEENSKSLETSQEVITLLGQMVKEYLGCEKEQIYCIVDPLIQKKYELEFKSKEEWVRYLMEEAV
jgi:hypothetical protein